MEDAVLAITIKLFHITGIFTCLYLNGMANKNYISRKIDIFIFCFSSRVKVSRESIIHQTPTFTKHQISGYICSGRMFLYFSLLSRNTLYLCFCNL